MTPSALRYLQAKKAYEEATKLKLDNAELIHLPEDHPLAAKIDQLIENQEKAAVEMFHAVADMLGWKPEKPTLWQKLKKILTLGGMLW